MNDCNVCSDVHVWLLVGYSRYAPQLCSKVILENTELILLCLNKKLSKTISLFVYLPFLNKIWLTWLEDSLPWNRSPCPHHSTKVNLKGPQLHPFNSLN